ncbi:MAG: demethoxyubiquinone hydroxylase family protein [Gammaproteobacteria bacterium]|nr:MAG: demethoxyubiquinone hydroxylase family protein [Gammaproteobacteria bacterium]
MPEKRRYSLTDRLIGQVDSAMRTLTTGASKAGRSSPSAKVQEGIRTEEEAKHSAGLMRINHTGEVCAQALYQGQALTAKLADTREAMEHAAQEEVDHLAWCEQRLIELESHPSHLSPLFYGISFAIGAAAGIAGDKWSLGFVAETEHQVCDHLERHLEQLPENDQKSRAILYKMSEDEAQHAATAIEAGAHPLPTPIRRMMTLTSKLMTATTYRL